MVNPKCSIYFSKKQPKSDWLFKTKPIFPRSDWSIFTSQNETSPLARLPVAKETQTAGKRSGTSPLASKPKKKFRRTTPNTPGFLRAAVQRDARAPPETPGDAPEEIRGIRADIAARGVPRAPRAAFRQNWSYPPKNFFWENNSKFVKTPCETLRTPQVAFSMHFSR